MALPFVTADDFEIVNSATEDQTEKLQNALNSLAGKGGLVWLGPLHVMITQVSLPRGVELRGVGTAPWGTWIEQFKDFNGSCITHDVNLPTNEWQHWGGVSHLRLTKQLGYDEATATGHGIFMDRAVGENFRCHDMLVGRWPEAGIRYAQGGTPCWIDNIHGGGCGTYMIDVMKPGNRRLQNCHIDRISSDSCGIAVIRIGGLGDWTENVHISHIKAESYVPGKQTVVVHLDAVNNIGTWIEYLGGANATASIPLLDSLVKVTNGTGGRVHVKGYIPGFPNVYHKTWGGVVKFSQDEVKYGQTFIYPGKNYTVYE